MSAAFYLPISRLLPSPQENGEKDLLMYDLIYLSGWQPQKGYLDRLLLALTSAIELRTWKTGVVR